MREGALGKRGGVGVRGGKTGIGKAEGKILEKGRGREKWCTKN